MNFTEKFDQTIGRVDISSPILLAPIAGVSDAAFRIICQEFGAGLTYTELISAEGLRRRQERTLRYAKFDESEHPIGIQLFGDRPESMAEAAVVGMELGYDLVDLNFGCPAKKVCRNNRGAALMKHPEQMEAIINAVISAVDLPVTIKMRSGWDESSINAVEIAKMAESAGVAAVAVHGRTKEQEFSGEADWQIIADVTESVNIPVIGNGDVFEPEDAAEMFRQTNCDFVMIARGAFGNPWIFRRVNAYLKSGIILPKPTPREKLEMCLHHFDLMMKYKGLPKAVYEIRKHISWYVKGMRNATYLRKAIFQLETPEAIREKITEFVEAVEADE
jgi:tRNA-dihydrouridine synthase B